ncbi:MAG TPA: tetratricopeptide repeat protein [Anaerolineae bacterium]|nr:tetratricopeptide repeat protein [Anaerolineae bacterium]
MGGSADQRIGESASQRVSELRVTNDGLRTMDYGLRTTDYVSRFTHHVSRFLLLALLLLSACAGPDISSVPLMVANHLYEAGKFAEAASAYQSLVDAGVAEGALYYNLGNAYFKTGDLGRAILNYRRAQQLLPRDADVAANLRLARAQTQDRLEADGVGGLAGFVQRALVAWTTLDEAAALALGLWGGLCALGMAALLWPRHRPALTYALAAVGVLLALSVLSVGARVVEARRAPAVVVAPSVEVRSGPGADYLTEFTLHAGAEVRVIEERGDWARIRLPGDLQGWAPGEAIVVVEMTP